MGLHDFNPSDSEVEAMDYLRGARQKPEARSQKTERKRKSWPQRRAYLGAWERCAARMGWEKADAARRKALRADVLDVLGEPPKDFDDLTPVEFGVVLWVLNEMADGRLPDAAAILDRKVVEKRKNLLWRINKLMDDYGRPKAWAVLRDRFKIVLIEELNAADLDTLEQIRRTLTARTYERKT
jgi:hypothetical protein